MARAKAVSSAMAFVMMSLVATGCSSYSSSALPAHGAKITAARIASELDPGRSRHKHFRNLIPGVKPHPHDPREPIPHGITTQVARPDPRAESGFKRLRGGLRQISGASRRASNVMLASDTGGQFGIYDDTNQQVYTATFGYQTGYQAAEMGFMMADRNVLYAPTNRGPGGNCLEIGSAYFGPTYALYQAKVYAYDFCDGIGEFHYLKDIDDDFRQNFERDWGDGLPGYFYETYYNRSTNRYTALLHDATQGQWISMYDSAGMTVGAQGYETSGWNMFETHYVSGGACPPALSAHGADAQWINPATNAWEYLDTMPHLTQQYHYLEPDMNCLNADDGSARGYWYALTFANKHDWMVDSYASLALIGGGGGCDPLWQDCCEYTLSCVCDIIGDCCDPIDGNCQCSGSPIIYHNPVDCGVKGLSRRRKTSGGRSEVSIETSPRGTAARLGSRWSP